MKSGSSLDNVLQKGVDFLSVFLSLNGAVAEPSRSDSACQARVAVDTTENVVRGGETLLMAGLWPVSKTNLIDQSIQAID